MRNGPQKVGSKNSVGIPQVVHSSCGGPSLKPPFLEEHRSCGMNFGWETCLLFISHMEFDDEKTHIRIMIKIRGNIHQVS